MFRSAVPVRPDTTATVSVRDAPLPPTATLPLGTSPGSEETTLTVRPSVGVSTSATVRLMVPERSSLPHAPPAATITVGGSLTEVTVRCAVAVFDTATQSEAQQV